ncbi:ECF RNA polymerase sigma factor SigW [compost metagenome]
MTQWHNGRLTDAVRRLDYTYREAIVLFYFHEMSIREIAGQLHTSESTIKSRLFRGRAALRKMWEQEETM